MLKALEKIDKFYILYTTVMLVMAGVAIYTYKVLFQSIIDLNFLDQGNDTQELRVDQTMFDEAYSFVYEKTPVKLNMK